MPKSIDYHSYLIESLKDPQEAEAYLKGALEEGDLEMIQVARRNVIEAGNGDICRKYQNYPEFINSPNQGIGAKSTHLHPIESKQQSKVRVPDNNSEKLWEVLTILDRSNKPRRGRSKRWNQKKKSYESFLERQSIVEKLSSYNEGILECAKAEVERQIEDCRLFLAMLAGFGVVVGYLGTLVESFIGISIKIIIAFFFAFMGIYILNEIGRRYLDLSLLKQALVLNNNYSVNSKE